MTFVSRREGPARTMRTVTATEAALVEELAPNAKPKGLASNRTQTVARSAPDFLAGQQVPGEVPDRATTSVRGSLDKREIRFSPGPKEKEQQEPSSPGSKELETVPATRRIVTVEGHHWEPGSPTAKELEPPQYTVVV